MSLKRTSRAQLLRPAGWACVLILGLGGVVGCSAKPLFKDESINCTSVEADYDFDSNAVSSPWCSGDTTPHYDAAAEMAANTTESVLGGGPCDLSTYAMVLRTSHYNDWGSTCGFSGFILTYTAATDAGTQLPIPRDESVYDGISFWARAAEGTSIGFTLSLDDANTTTAAKGEGGHCKEYNAVDGGISGSTTVIVADPVTGQVLTGVAVASRQPDECGNNKSNGYSYVMAVTNQWAFYTVPWANFTQAAYPNRVPNSILAAGTVPGTGLLTNQLFGVNIRPPKEAPFELWVDNMRFYRKKLPNSGSDAAVGPVGSGGATTGAGGAPAGAGGSSGSTGNDGVACPLPAQALISDFTYTAVDGGATDSVHFGDSTTLAGSTYVYPTSGSYVVTSDVSQSNWHISGTLGDYSGFGLNFDNCSRVNASAYLGIQFTISGSVPQGNIVTLGVGTLNDTITSDWLNVHGGSGTVKPGRCVPTSGSNQYNQSTCADPMKTISVTATPAVQRVLWTDFAGGKPETAVTPTDILSVYWFFPPPAGAGTATPAKYPVDIVIDDLQFITP